MNRLEAVQRILQDTGVKYSDSLTETSDMTRGDSCLRQAFYDILSADNWSWMRTTSPTYTVTGAVLGIENLQTVHHAYWEGQELVCVPAYTFNSSRFSPPKEGNPCVYTVHFDKISFSPYPTDWTNLVVDVTVKPAFPTNADSPFSMMPPSFEELMIRRGVCLYLLRHVKDVESYQLVDREYSLSLKMHRDQNRSSTPSSTSMWKGFSPYGRTPF